MFEAQAIALEIEKISSNRPMTHDLFKSFAGSFGITVKEVIISNLKEGIFYATMICEGKDGEIIELDARPSDAIAVGIRFKSPIFADESVMEEAGIKVDDLYDEDDEEEEISLESEEDADLIELLQDKENELSDIPSNKLEEMMKQAIEAEDYERAAKIRDELNNRNS
ncbi:bifunctional nuclease family protein [Algivirga pacifica]|uniref:Bifunctional nuclease family protein n=2 Tax=Algivirga pacifica TaxID=1162670 RepID=A0ABP9CYS4_9BACT